MFPVTLSNVLYVPMAKTTHPERHKERRPQEGEEPAETTLSVDRVTRVVKGGRRLRFRAVVVVGNRKGKVGIGTGKANEVRSAVEKATKVARKNMIIVPMQKGTIPHEVDAKFKAARVRLLPASDGTGIIAGGAVRVILEHAGVKNVLGKRLGTNNALVNAQAVMKALSMLKTRRGGKQDEKAVLDGADDSAHEEESDTSTNEKQDA
jgi:small subunit ribosomal protein S5